MSKRTTDWEGSIIKVEKGIKIPKPKHRRYPWTKMGVGDSFFVPCERHEKVKVATSILQAARHQRPARYITRVVDGGIRVWRIE